jgi:hypothetical protein
LKPGNRPAFETRSIPIRESVGSVWHDGPPAGLFLYRRRAGVSGDGVARYHRLFSVYSQAPDSVRPNPDTPTCAAFKAPHLSVACPMSVSRLPSVAT